MVLPSALSINFQQAEVRVIISLSLLGSYFVANEPIKLCYGRALQRLGSFSTMQFLCRAPWPSQSKLLACSQLARKWSDDQHAWFLSVRLLQSGKYLMCFLAMHLLEQSS